MNRLGLATAFAVTTIAATGAQAMTLQLDGYTATPVQSVNVDASPVPDTPSTVGATGFHITDTSGSMGSFVAWCLDISHYLMSVGDSQEYNATNDPYSNSFGLSSTAKTRVQAMFDANYDSVDFFDADQAAAWQMALWEAAYEGARNVLSLADGLFEADSSGSDVLAASYLSAAQDHIDNGGSQNYVLTFLEVDETLPRGTYSGQNLVTATAIPLPATALMLLSGVFGLGAVARRRRNAA